MKRFITTALIALLPTLLMAQKAGGEVKRPQKKPETTQQPVQQQKQATNVDRGTYNSSGGFYVKGTERSVSNPSVGNPWLLEQVKGWGRLQNGCISASAEGALIYDTNGYACTSGLNQGLKDKIAEINKSQQRINDVNVLNNGGYVIAWSRNAFQMFGHPQALYDKTNAFWNQGEEIRSICFNTAGSWWCVVTANNWAADESTSVLIRQAISLYGQVVSVFVSDMGRVICCENGVYCDNVPSTLFSLLKTLSFKPRYVKFTDDGKYIVTNDQTQAMYVWI